MEAPKNERTRRQKDKGQFPSFQLEEAQQKIKKQVIQLKICEVEKEALRRECEELKGMLHTEKALNLQEVAMQLKACDLDREVLCEEIEALKQELKASEVEKEALRQELEELKGMLQTEKALHLQEVAIQLKAWDVEKEVLCQELKACELEKEALCHEKEELKELLQAEKAAVKTEAIIPDLQLQLSDTKLEFEDFELLPLTEKEEALENGLQEMSPSLVKSSKPSLMRRVISVLAPTQRREKKKKEDAKIKSTSSWTKILNCFRRT